MLQSITAGDEPRIKQLKLLLTQATSEKWQILLYFPSKKLKSQALLTMQPSKLIVFFSGQLVTKTRTQKYSVGYCNK